jgi:anti-anti-sigma factor
MSTPPVQNWQSHPFSIERRQGKTAGTVIYHLRGPFTARDMYGTLTPLQLQQMLEFKSVPAEQLPVVHILDLTQVPYVDSSGLGMIVAHHVRCQNRGLKMIAAGASPRVMELFKMTKVDGFLPLAATVEEVDN